jgi:hydrogenase maturation protease
VLGAGNVLLGDEGVGVHVVEALQDHGVPDDVEVVDAGTAVLDALAALGRVDTLIVVDAVEAAGPPGAIYRFSPDSVMTAEVPPPMSLHDIGLLDTLEMAGQIGLRPGNSIVFGVVPEKVDWGLDLSPAVAARVPELVDRVCDEIERVREAGVPANASELSGTRKE